MSGKSTQKSDSAKYTDIVDFDNRTESTDFFLSKRQANPCCEHSHSFFELEIILSNFGNATYNGVTYPIKKGITYISSPSDSHSLSFQSPDENSFILWNMSFKDSFFSQELMDLILYSKGDKITYLDEATLNKVCALFDIIYSEQNIGNPFSADICTQCAEAMLKIILRNMRAENSDAGSNCIFEALRYIQTHFMENISQEDVARHTGLSTPYFSMLFSREIGCGYKDYLTQLRVYYAKKLIKNSGYKASDACYAAGFNSYSSFLKAFTKLVGISPTEYAKKKQLKNPHNSENN